MYDSRYAHDVAELEYIAGEEGGEGPECDPSELIDAHPFPEYVMSYCGRQYGQGARPGPGLQACPVHSRHIYIHIVKAP